MKKLDKYVDRSKSVVTGKDNLKPLWLFKDFPVFFGCTDEPREDDLVADMNWAIDEETGMIQLSKLVPLDILYMEQHIDPLGKTWTEYNDAFSSFVLNHTDENVIEIGSGNGIIANLILDKSPSIKVTCVEPNPTFEESDRLTIIKEFFTDDFNHDLGEDQTVIFSQLYEHVYDPEEFMIQISEFLPFGGKMIFAYPQLEYWFKEKFTNAINFEHSMLMTDYFVDLFLDRAGFRILEKEEYKKHSHFYVVEKVKSRNTMIKCLNKYDHYKEMFFEFVDYHLDMVDKINLSTNRANGHVFLFGGHIFSQFLIAFGLWTNNITYILDNSEIKQEKRLYGTDLIVKSPKILADYKKPVVILKAGLYNDEIKKDILENINPETVFI